ncbi:hypothetical protein ACS0TY_010515 [Phlomoides rotata]
MLLKMFQIHVVENAEENNYLKEFSDWIDSIGDCTVGLRTDYGSEVVIPDDIFIRGGENPIETMDRVILAPTLDVVRSINDHMISLNSKEARTYLSFDQSCMSDSNFDIHTPEILNTLKCSGIPDHELNLKV